MPNLVHLRLPGLGGTFTEHVLGELLSSLGIKRRDEFAERGAGRAWQRNG
jgi:hypothetical protein